MKSGATGKRHRLRRVLTALALLLCALPSAAAPARAAGPPDGAGSIEELWSRGERAFKAGDLETAQRLFETALSGDERRARSWNYVGGVHFAQGDLTRALAEFRKALELDPRDVRACNNLGTVLERLGDYPGAEAAYGRAVVIDPSYALTQRNLGILLARRLGNPDAARRAWLRYLELAPSGAYADEIRRELAGSTGADDPPAPAPATTPPAAATAEDAAAPAR